MNRILKEPLFHFLALAAGLFIANALFSVDDRELIEVDIATQQYLVDQAQSIQLRELSEEEKQGIIEAFLEDEILVREARKRGFENSSRIRTLLIQNMRFFMAAEVPEISDEELRSWFEANPERFMSRATTNYLHVVYSNPSNIPADLLDRLNAGEDHTQFGDGEFLTSRLVGLAEAQIVGTFGPEQGRVILELDGQQWHGPFESVQGAHFLKISQRNEPRLPDWESARNWASTEWIAEQNRAIVDKKLAEMRQNYRIEIEQPQPEAP